MFELGSGPATGFMPQPCTVQLVVAVAAAALLAAGCKPAAPPVSPAAASCHRSGTDTEPTPDLHCTPGATNPQVRPAHPEGDPAALRPPDGATAGPSLPDVLHP